MIKDFIKAAVPGQGKGEPGEKQPGEEEGDAAEDEKPGEGEPGEEEGDGAKGEKPGEGEPGEEDGDGDEGEKRGEGEPTEEEPCKDGKPGAAAAKATIDSYDSNNGTADLASLAHKAIGTCIFPW